MQQPAQLSTRMVAADKVSASDVAAWAALESRASEPNAFLSPHFVIPSARHLTPEQVPQVLIVERQRGAARDVVGIAVVTEESATRQVPVRRLAGYRSRHSFLSGLLLDREGPEQVFDAMLGFIREAFPRCKAVGMPQVWSDGPLAAPGGIASKACEFSPLLTETTPRAILRPSDCEAQLQDKALARRIRDLDRRQRRLRQLGELAWRCHRSEGIPAESIEAFLTLEHMGWKGEQGSSLRSRPEDEAFFRDMVAGFATQRRVMFAELTLDGEPIASICNLVSGSVGFCFKIGWNPAFRSNSPALINELPLRRHRLFRQRRQRRVLHQRAVAGTPRPLDDPRSHRGDRRQRAARRRLGGSVDPQVPPGGQRAVGANGAGPRGRTAIRDRDRRGLSSAAPERRLDHGFVVRCLRG
jgi:CelD/BcsL family acetyltransferase involved in cellulose biosynthesis